MILITGGSGFIGSHLCDYFLNNTDYTVLVLDRISYAGSLERLRESKEEFGERLRFIFHDFRAALPGDVLKRLEGTRIIIHNGGESHVEPSIANPELFIQSNVLGTMHMLNAGLKLGVERFLYCSTDEVFGPSNGEDFPEDTPHKPSSPYAATKSAAESLTRAWHTTYKLPVMITRTMNIFGEKQHPEKFIPGMICRLLNGEPVQIHATPTGEIGSRKWLYAEDYARALHCVLSQPDASPLVFNIAGEERTNLEMAEMVAQAMGKPLTHEVVDANKLRPGHDMKYGIDDSNLRSRGWCPKCPVAQNVEKVVGWTLNHREWLES